MLGPEVAQSYLNLTFFLLFSPLLTFTEEPPTRALAFWACVFVPGCYVPAEGVGFKDPFPSTLL